MMGATRGFLEEVYIQKLTMKRLEAAMRGNRKSLTEAMMTVGVRRAHWHCRRALSVRNCDLAKHRVWRLGLGAGGPDDDDDCCVDDQQ